MARIRAERDIPDKNSAKAKAKAEVQLSGGKKRGRPAKATAEPTVHEQLPSPEEFLRFFDRIKSAERKHEKARAEAKELTTAAKAGLNKAYADAQAAMIGRKLSIRSLKRLYALSNRDEDELTAEITGETWAMRALGFEVGQQLVLFAEAVGSEKDALAKAKRDGRDAGARGDDGKDNPHPANTKAWHAWSEGYWEGQASITPGNVTRLRKPDNGDVDNDPDFDEVDEQPRRAAE